MSELPSGELLASWDTRRMQSYPTGRAMSLANRLLLGISYDPTKFLLLTDENGKQFKSACWIWTGVKHEGAYGRILLAWKKDGLSPIHRLVHRISYELFLGIEIPKGLVLHHECENTACFRPEHLTPMTPGENTLLGNGICARYARAAYCQRNHKKTPENTGRDGRCLECEKENRADPADKERRRKNNARYYAALKASGKKKKWDPAAYARNRDKILARQAKFYADNKERLSARQAEYRAKNRDKYNERERERYARKQAAKLAATNLTQAEIKLPQWAVEAQKRLRERDDCN